MAREKFFSQPSVMTAQQHFSQAPNAEIQRSRFDRSHAVKTTFDAGLLIPIFLDEVLPGDTFNLSTTNFTRLATPIHPIMDNLYLDTHFFFVPNRLLFNQWAEFMGERPSPDFDPNEVSLPVQPWHPPSVPNNMDSVGAYFGLPRLRSDEGSPEQISCLPFRAYKLVYNEWYRDQNLQNPQPFHTGDYDSSLDTDFAPYRRGKRHDYFTSCLPWPQKGDPVSINLTGSAPVMGYRPTTTFNRTIFAHDQVAQGQPSPNPTPQPVALFGATGDLDGPLLFDTNYPYLEESDVDATYLHPNRRVGTADLSAATAITINQLRTAFQIQKMLERDARGGTRYIELILSHFGVRSDDARLQRPEYLGGGTSRVNVNPIASTAGVPTEAPQGNLAGVGTSINRAGFTKSFTEHGIIIGLVSARADLTYQNGLERMWTRATRYDYYWPTLAHLGEQAVLNKEIFYQGTGSDNGVFGYQERYAEYRYKPSLVTGLFNSHSATSLDPWHLAQEFDVLPGLGAGFIQEDPPIDRVIAVPSEPHFLCDIWHALKCDRPMPVYSVPGLIDHF